MEAAPRVLWRLRRRTGAPGRGSRGLAGRQLHSLSTVPKAPKLVYPRIASAAPVPGQPERHGLVALATLLGLQLQPQLPPLCSVELFLSLALLTLARLLGLPLPGLPSAALCLTDSNSALRLSSVILVLWAPPLPVYTLGFAQCCTWFCLSWKFLEGGGHILSCKSTVSGSSMCSVEVVPGPQRAFHLTRDIRLASCRITGAGCGTVEP